MDNLSLIEEHYKKFVLDLNSWLPEGVMVINLELLDQMDLLSTHQEPILDPSLNRYFHVIETEEKITLVNSEFVVWIVPSYNELIPSTYTFIALNKQNSPKLEMAFITSGVYNSSRLVLRVLEKLLKEIQETEEWMNKVARKPNNL